MSENKGGGRGSERKIEHEETDRKRGCLKTKEGGGGRRRRLEEKG